MKKPISNSASENLGTSSPSGTSGPTDDTGKNRAPRKQTSESPFQYLVDDLAAMTTEEFVESAIRAGILDEDGNLAEHYR